MQAFARKESQVAGKWSKKMCLWSVMTDMERMEGGTRAGESDEVGGGVLW